MNKRKQDHKIPGRAPAKHPAGSVSRSQAPGRRPAQGRAASTDRNATKGAHKNFTVQEPGELLPFLIQSLTGEGRNSIKSMLARGQVSVSGRAVTAYNHPLQPGQTVTVSKEKVIEQFPFVGVSIMYEDEHVIVIQKDSGLLSVSTNAQDQELTAYRQLTAHVRNHDPKSRIFVLHRLDRDTSGVMMFAKSEAVQQQLQTTWQESVKERKYVALVEGTVKQPEGKITSWLKENKAMKMYSSPYPNDGQYAETHYKVLQSDRHFSLVEIELETGRKNQIRVHMQDIGHPIVGDKKYGSITRPIGRLGLHARVLAFEHPVTGRIMRFETDIPKLFVKVFQPGFEPRR
ncbi:RluA family pseudouridine synthase [Paenibacillus aestuarii]|uniref:Pseudouridine synthase n=1 Tax=Paenibacillus aestuarii TaxID=516965 RepID=A0ABW0K8P1_9BACL|nr:RluA family pseudouridine synthase [Paenibacillus aestuarii]